MDFLQVQISLLGHQLLPFWTSSNLLTIASAYTAIVALTNGLAALGVLANFKTLLLPIIIRLFMDVYANIYFIHLGRIGRYYHRLSSWKDHCLPEH